MRKSCRSRSILCLIPGILLTSQALAGAADVSADELYSDDVTLTAADGSPIDINGDGNTDLVVASNLSDNPGSSRYYPGNGDGTFGDAVLLGSGASSEIVAADLNGDMLVDLVQGRRDLTSLFYLGDGSGVGTDIDISADTDRVLAVAVGDLDADGDLDLVTGTGHRGGEPETEPPQENRYYLNDGIPPGGGAPTFTGADISADADDTRSIALADMDGDGDLDVIAGNDETTPGSNLVYLNQFVESGNATVSFAAGIGFGPPDDQTGKLLIGDLNDDGQPDVVALNFVVAGLSQGTNRFFLNETQAAGTFTLGDGIDISADADMSSGGTLADFDGDGDLDIAVANVVGGGAGGSARNRLYLNQLVESGNVTFIGIDLSANEHQSRELAAGDINDDGHVDLIAGNQAFGDVPGRDRRYLNNGTADPFANVAPVIDGYTGTLETEQDTALAIVLDEVTVTDPDNAFPADFTLTVQAGTNYTVTDNNITPDAGFSGELVVPVVVSDGTDDSAAFELAVTVVGAGGGNNAPSFSSTAVTSATEDEAYEYEISASDPDPGAVLEITAPTLPGWLTLTDNGDGTGTLAGTPGAGDVGDQDVSLVVSDGVDTAVQDFTITVAAAAAPPPPSPAPPSDDGDSGGGSLGLWSLLALIAFGATRRRHRRV